MCSDIGENYIIPNVAWRLILTRQVEHDKNTDLSSFNTRVLGYLA